MLIKEILLGRGVWAPVSNPGSWQINWVVVPMQGSTIQLEVYYNHKNMETMLYWSFLADNIGGTTHRRVQCNHTPGCSLKIFLASIEPITQQRKGCVQSQLHYLSVQENWHGTDYHGRMVHSLHRWHQAQKQVPAISTSELTSEKRCGLISEN